MSSSQVGVYRTALISSNALNAKSRDVQLGLNFRTSGLCFADEVRYLPIPSRPYAAMPTRRRNEYLDAADSDSEGGSDHGYDSEAAEQSRGTIAGRATKRPRLEEGSDDESVSQNDFAEAEQDPSPEADSMKELAAAISEEDDASDETARPISLKTSTPKQVAAAQKAAKRSGVVYISRVPPFMKPQTLKHFLAPHAPKGLGRIFLTPEDHAAHIRRVRNGGNKKKSFTDGWVEFVSKRDAKRAADLLNGNIIGGKKGNFYHDDLWSMKYLKGFKWNHLTEQIAHENAEREARMREEIRRTKQENKAFVEDIEMGKMLEGMATKNAKRKGGDGGTSGKVRKGAEFKQKTVQQRQEGEKLSDQARKVQSLIF